MNKLTAMEAVDCQAKSHVSEKEKVLKGFVAKK